MQHVHPVRKRPQVCTQRGTESARPQAGGFTGSEMAGTGERGHASGFPWSEQSQTTHEKMAPEGLHASQNRRCQHKKEKQTPASAHPDPHPGWKGVGVRDLDSQSLNRHVQTTWTLDSLNTVDRRSPRYQQDAGGCTDAAWSMHNVQPTIDGRRGNNDAVCH